MFGGDFAPIDAERVVGDPDVVDALHRLVNHSLLRPVSDGRLGFLDPIARSPPSTWPSTARSRPPAVGICSSSSALAETARLPPLYTHQTRARRDWDNVLAALSFAVSVDGEAAARLVLYVARELGRLGQHREALLRLREVLATEPSPRAAIALRIAILNTSAVFNEDVWAALDALEPEVRSYPDPELWAELLLSRAQGARRRGRPLEAEQLGVRAMDTLAGFDGPHPTRAWAALTLAGARLDQGRFDDAIATYDEAGALARRAGDVATEGQVLWGRGLLEVMRGRPGRGSAPRGGRRAVR